MHSNRSPWHILRISGSAGGLSAQPSSTPGSPLPRGGVRRGSSVRRATKSASDGTKLRGVDIRMAAAFALKEAGGKMPHTSVSSPAQALHPTPSA